MPFNQFGGGNCTICKSPGTNRSTCPCNPDIDESRYNYNNHPNWINVGPTKRSTKQSSPKKVKRSMLYPNEYTSEFKDHNVKIYRHNEVKQMQQPKKYIDPNLKEYSVKIHKPYDIKLTKYQNETIKSPKKETIKSPKMASPINGKNVSHIPIWQSPEYCKSYIDERKPYVECSYEDWRKCKNCKYMSH
jgi:hypothetical protein